MNVLRKIFASKDEHSREVFLKSAPTIVVQVIGISARLITSVILGRLMGASGLGDVNLINQILTILMVISMFGMDHVLVKKISINFSNKDFVSIGKTIYTSLVVNIFIASLLTFFSLIFSGLLSDFFSNNKLQLPFIVAVLVIVPQTIGIVFASSLNGFNKVWQSRFLKDFCTSFLVLLGVFLCRFLNISINVINVISIYSISRIITFIISAIAINTVYKPVFITSKIDKSMIKMAKPLLLVSATTLLFSSNDIIMLGWLTNSSNVGLYTVATRLVFFIAFFLQITNAAISPKIAALFAVNKLKEIDVMVKRVTFWLILIGFVSTLFFVFFGNYILNFWGIEFTKAYYCLIILCFGQFINVSTGCSGILLIMTNNEKIFSYLTSIFVVVNLILNYFLISLYGIIGAAIATSLTIAIENIIRVIVVKKKTGILTMPFGLSKIKN